MAARWEHALKEHHQGKAPLSAYKLFAMPDVVINKLTGFNHVWACRCLEDWAESLVACLRARNAGEPCQGLSRWETETELYLQVGPLLSDTGGGLNDWAYICHVGASEDPKETEATAEERKKVEATEALPV